MITKGEKFVISFVLLLVLILNFSVPFVYAIEKAAEKIEPVQYCNLFCNLSPSMAKESEKVLCPHHLREIKKKRLTDHFQCRIGPASCHDNAPIANTSSAGEPCLLSKHPINQVLIVSFLDFYYSTISSQTVISFLEKPPSKRHS
ncbi:MAG: hypothetical protein AABY58_01105 [Nitrospirota bacterium]